MQAYEFSDKERRLNGLSRAVIAFDVDRVNVDDLVADVPAGYPRLVRCFGNPKDIIHVFSVTAEEGLGCVAGWISDED